MGIRNLLANREAWRDIKTANGFMQHIDTLGKISLEIRTEEAIRTSPNVIDGREAFTGVPLTGLVKVQEARPQPVEQNPFSPDYNEPA